MKVPFHTTIEKFRFQIQSQYKDWIKWLILLGFLYLVGLTIPEGYDWVHNFSDGTMTREWTPWAGFVARLINFPFLVAMTLFIVIYRTYRYNPSPFPMILAVLSLPTLWVIFLGNLDGFVLLGIEFLPIGVPLVLMKPQVAAFSLLSKKKHILAGVIWLLISLMIWGFWPLDLLEVFSPRYQLDFHNEITLFPWGLILAVPLMLFSKGDEDLLMAAGSFATPHLFPYHFILLMPALGRLNKRWMVLTWIVSWLPLTSNWLGSWAWHFGNLIPALIWVGIFKNEGFSFQLPEFIRRRFQD